MLTTIPFSGFYESLHNSAFDCALEGIFSDSDTGCCVNEPLMWKAHDCINWRMAHELYAKEYAESLAHEFGINSLKFESLSSPREYNFTTDRIFCTIEYADLCRLMATFDLPDFAAYVREKFTSRDGFISFYDADLSAWGAVSSWDHNQCGTALEFYSMQENAGEFEHYHEWALMENAQCNGVFDEILFKAGGDEFSRLVRLHDYLQERINRKAA